MKTSCCMHAYQNEEIIIGREFDETVFNEFMIEEHTYQEACKEILKMKAHKTRADEKQINWIMENNKWKRIDTCNELKISKDTLRRKMIKFNLHQPNLT